MIGGRWVPGGAWLIVFSCASCGASNQPKACPLPSTAPQGTLAVSQINELGSDYEVLSITYALDDCVLHCSDDPAMLRKQTVVVEPRKVSTGPHQFRYMIKVHDASGTRSYDGKIPVDVLPGGTDRITLRVFDDQRARASDRIRIIVQRAHGTIPPAQAAAAASAR